jgi:hypothetical protein
VREKKTFANLTAIPMAETTLQSAKYDNFMTAGDRVARWFLFSYQKSRFG